MIIETDVMIYDRKINVIQSQSKSFFKDKFNNEFITEKFFYDITKNLYQVSVGTSLEFWEQNGWINTKHPYGWVHWYCDFYLGKRCKDDERQISRWIRIASPKGRFFKQLVNLITKKHGSFNDLTISPKIRQTLQHWAYKLTEEDFLTYK